MRIAIGLSVAGVVAIILGAVWITAVFPGLKKIPTDWDQTVEWEGTYAVVAEREFIQELLANASVGQVLGSPSTLQLLAKPETQQLLAGGQLDAELIGSVAGLLSDPAVSKLIFSPNTAAVLANPLVPKLLGSPEVLTQLLDPDVQAALGALAAGQPPDASILPLLQNELVQELLAAPETLQLLLSEETKLLLSSPLVGVVSANPALLGLLTNPAIPPLLGDPVILQLLGDPTGLGLVTDPRTLRILADPANLPLDEFEVTFRRLREGDSDLTKEARDNESIESGVLLIRQTFDDVLFQSAAAQGTPLDRGDFSSTAVLAVEREDRLYVPGGSEPRIGRFAFPFDVKKDQKYPIWIHEVWDAPLAEFVEEDEVNGLDVYTFRIKEEGLVLPPEPKRIQKVPENLPLIASVVNVTKTEPKSGVTVDVQSSITYRLANDALGNPVVFQGDLTYSDESIASSVDDAEDIRFLLFWVGIFLPWTLIGLGIVFLVGGAVFMRGRMAANSA